MLIHTLSLELTRRLLLRLINMEIRLLTVLPEQPNDFPLQSIHHHIGGYTVSLKEQVQSFMCISLSLHCMRS